MAFWLNGIRDGSLCASQMFASEAGARSALQVELTLARERHRRLVTNDMTGFLVWIVRDSTGAIQESWWISGEKLGPAVRSTDSELALGLPLIEGLARRS